MATPTYDDVASAFARVRSAVDQAEGDRRRRLLPLSRWEALSQWSDSLILDLRRCAAYQISGAPAPLGYYDGMLDRLYYAAEELVRMRTEDHGRSRFCLAPGASLSQAGCDLVRDRQPPKIVDQK